MKNVMLEESMRFGTGEMVSTRTLTSYDSMVQSIRFSRLNGEVFIDNAAFPGNFGDARIYVPDNNSVLLNSKLIRG